jgi:hypothetical protein
MQAGIVYIAGMLVCALAVADEGFVGLVDPTRPAAAPIIYEAIEPVPTGPVLQSTIVAPGFKRAVINGKTYKVGETVGAGIITDIRPYEVILAQDGRETRLRLVPHLAKESVGRPGSQAKE